MRQTSSVLACVCVGVVFGIVAEFGARRLRLWIYRRPLYPIINVVAVFGLAMGGLAAFVPMFGRIPAFLVAFAAGLGYEILNLTRLHWWDFPGARLAFIHGHPAIVVTVAAMWGFVPVLIATIYGLSW